MKVVLLTLILKDCLAFLPTETQNHPCHPEKLREAFSYICSTTGKVICQSGWKEPEDPKEVNLNHPCPIPVCENCQNGVCLAPNKCICEIGWDGPSCDICIPLPGCVHGDCKDKALTCDCEPNWQGAYCDAPICDDCINGKCIEPNNCACFDGWKGPNCSECIALKDCDHGFCKDYPNTCECEEGWTGHLCNQPFCSSGCLNGRCIDGGILENYCICDQGWSGKDCGTCIKYWDCPKQGSCINPNDCFCDPNLSVLCTAQKIFLKFQVKDIIMNQVMENVEVKIITEENEVKTNSTDSEGLVELGPLAQGSDVTLSIFHPGYDNYNQNFVAQNDLDFIKIGLNPFSAELRLALTWNPKVSDLDAGIKFFLSNGKEICHLKFANKICKGYASFLSDSHNGGPETISIKGIRKGVTALYYVQDSTFSIGNSLTWSDVGAKVEIFAPNGTGSLKIPLNWDTKDRFKRFYVIGCLKSLELSKFSVVGMAERLPNFSMCQ